MPSIAHPEDGNGQDGAVIEQFTEMGVIADGHVHPIVERWLQNLDRPMELAAVIVDVGLNR
ncbi:hypothetical protein ACQP0C_07770 [Nocardia sp. CA-129566]|uniref:hypothetical protein n=1 Tax=Nocardia sp. CA-129566 TaxID=3239976 RepID=UPI003D96F1CD